MRIFGDKCNKNNIVLIPLIQSFGHMENTLIRKEFLKFREQKDDPRAVCPLKGGAHEIIKAMIDETVNVFPDIKNFHLGGDEVDIFGTCPSCKNYIRMNGKISLYLKQMVPLLDYLNDKYRIRPILWHDMMISWGIKNLSWLAKRADLMLWIYDQKTWVQNGWNLKIPTEEMISKFIKSGVNLWGAGAYRCGGEGVVPDIYKRTENIKTWCAQSGKMPLKGFFITGWSRGNYLRVPYGPFENAVQSLCLCSKIMWDGDCRLEDDAEGINEYFGKFINRKISSLNADLFNLLEKLDRAYLVINADRGFREGGGSNINELAQSLDTYEKGLLKFKTIKKKILKELKQYAFPRDAEKWIGACEKMTFEKFHTTLAKLKKYLKKTNSNAS